MMNRVGGKLRHCWDLSDCALNTFYNFNIALCVKSCDFMLKCHMIQNIIMIII